MHSDSKNSVGPPYCRVEMCAGYIACCPLVSHGEYADRSDRQINGRQTVTSCFLLDVESVLTWAIMQGNIVLLVIKKKCRANHLSYVLCDIWHQCSAAFWSS